MRILLVSLFLFSSFGHQPVYANDDFIRLVEDAIAHDRAVTCNIKTDNGIDISYLQFYKDERIHPSQPQFMKALCKVLNSRKVSYFDLFIGACSKSLQNTPYSAYTDFGDYLRIGIDYLKIRCGKLK